MKMDELTDGRDLPIFIHSELDDLRLTSKAFRVYAHLARLAKEIQELTATTSELKQFINP